MRCRGRPLISISEQELTNLLQLNFTQTETANLYGCSCRTIHRRIAQFELDVFIRYYNMTNNDLDQTVGILITLFHLPAKFFRWMFKRISCSTLEDL